MLKATVVNYLFKLFVRLAANTNELDNLTLRQYALKHIPDPGWFNPRFDFNLDWFDHSKDRIIQKSGQTDSAQAEKLS